MTQNIMECQSELVFLAFGLIYVSIYIQLISDNNRKKAKNEKIKKRKQNYLIVKQHVCLVLR